MKKGIICIIFTMLVLTFGTIAFRVDARTTSGQIKLSELIEKDKTDVIEDTLLIEQDDLEYLGKVDLEQYNFKNIWLEGIYLKSAKKLNLKKKLENLDIHNSVVNMSTFDLNNYDSINIYDSYNIGKKVKSSKINNDSFINEEYRNVKKYNKKLNKIAKKIKKQSNGTKEDMIRLVTLYVVKKIEYDYNGEYTGLNAMDSIMKYNKGVCVNYAEFEAQLLRRLGIYALHVVGTVNDSSVAHAWDIVYFKNKWYSLDPTWLDTEEGIKNLERNEYNSNYMSSMDNQEFNDSHVLYFTSYNKIPKKYLKVK